MNQRQKELFKCIIEEYIATAAPVGSQLMVDKYFKNVSSATIRNEMIELENLGLIFQPHTSAGRVPSESGYRQYVEENVDVDEELSEGKKNEITGALEHWSTGAPARKNIENKIKILAKILAEKSGLSVVVGFSKNNFYYTGLSNLFSQPEFQNLDLVYNLSRVIDHLDEVMAKVYNEVNNQIQIKIGRENSFGNECASVMIKVKNVLIGIVGPMRMEYQKNIELMNFIKIIV